MLLHIFCRFPGNFIVKTTFEEFEEICKQIHKEHENQYINEKEIIDSNDDYLRIFQLRNMFLNI